MTHWGLILVILVLFTLFGCALVSQLPQNASLFKTQAVQCPNGELFLFLYDTDGDVDNGAEVMVLKNLAKKTLATLYFAAGSDGRLTKALIGSETFTSMDAIAAKYPDACHLLIESRV